MCMSVYITYQHAKQVKKLISDGRGGEIKYCYNVPLNEIEIAC